jgi:hypothetical protein
MATYCQSGPAMQWKILSLAVASKLSLPRIDLQALFKLGGKKKDAYIT